MGMTKGDVKGMTKAEVAAEFAWLVDRLARSYARAGVELDDLKQEGFVGLLTALEAWQAGCSFKSYADLRIREHMRNLLGRVDGSLDALDVPTESFDALGSDGATMHDSFGAPATQEQELGEAETRALVRDAVSMLPSEGRSIVYAEMQGETHEAIAVRLGVARQTVTDRSGEAKKRLTRLLKHRVESGAPRAA